MCFVGSSPTNDAATLTFEESKGCPILFLRLRHMLSEPQRSSAQCKTRSTNELPMFSVRMRGCARHLGAQPWLGRSRERSLKVPPVSKERCPTVSTALTLMHLLSLPSVSEPMRERRGFAKN